LECTDEDEKSFQPALWLSSAEEEADESHRAG
jgi:hypothetical protein